MLGMNDELIAQFDDAFLGVLQEARTKTSTLVPYAFGGLPLRPYGDVIGHGASGLFGAINVRPADWEEVADQAPQGSIPGTYLWADGTAPLRAGGIWALIEVLPNGEGGCP